MRKWKLIRTKVGFDDDPDFAAEQGTYPDSDIYSYTGPDGNAGAAFYVEFYSTTGAPVTGRGQYDFTVFERAVWGDPALSEWDDIDGLSGEGALGYSRVDIQDLSLESARFGVRVFNIEPPDGADALRIFAIAYVQASF